MWCLKSDFLKFWIKSWIIIKLKLNFYRNWILIDWRWMCLLSSAIHLVFHASSSHNKWSCRAANRVRPKIGFSFRIRDWIFGLLIWKLSQKIPIKCYVQNILPNYNVIKFGFSLIDSFPVINYWILVGLSLNWSSIFVELKLNFSWKWILIELTSN
jgi:hypothetical protein